MSDPADIFALPETLRVLVTAGASGIGRAAADLLIARGAQVHICDVADEFLADYCAAHPKAGVTKADVASDADVSRLFADVKASSNGGLTHGCNCVPTAETPSSSSAASTALARASVAIG